MKKALIWGGDGDMGRAIAQALTGEGWEVMITHRQWAGDPGMPHAEADVADEFSVQQAVMAAGQELGEVNLWVYAVGDIQSAKVADQSFADWQRILSANLSGAFLTAHHSMPILAGDAHLVFIGAVSERLQLPGLGAYVAAKAGLEAFVTSLRKEERKRAITLLRPGAVDTKFWEKVPLTKPRSALAPAAIAQAVLDAYATGKGGVVDI
jgi:NAD(P)-dependent dehydrogenase (short-subunit alcohol dehydrogenase family)